MVGIMTRHVHILLTLHPHTPPAGYNPDESNVPLWAWLGLFILANAYWIIFDLWARANNHEYMTTEFREGLHSELLGPFVLGLTAFTVTAFVVHMLQIGSKA
jgi:hypothetical protein